LTTELSFAFNSGPPANWNPLAASAASDALTAVADQVLPSVFNFGPSFNPTLNDTLMQSANQTSQSPQTIVYRINPKATWSDGAPITGADFVYNWQSQSGKGADIGGRAFTPASASGYNLVQSVTVSPASPDEITVVFSTPYPDWTRLFRHLIPAHIAERVGFNAGFTDPVADLVSGGPYEVAAFDPSGFLRLVRNPSYWGPPASTLELDFRFVPDPQQLSTALLQSQIDCAEVPPTQAVLSPLRASKNLNVMVAPGAVYLDIEFRQSSGPLHAQPMRAAVTSAISRQAVIAAALGAVEPAAPPLANRFLVSGENGYSPHGPPSVVPGAHPTGGALALGFDHADPVALSAAQSIAQQMDSAGFSVTTTGLDGAWDLAVRDHPLSPFPTEAMQTYVSGSPTNTTGVSDSALDAAVNSSMAAADGQRLSIVNQVDQEAWSDYADLPVVAIPQAVVCQTNVTGVSPNPSPDGPAYNASGWGLAPGGP
jgi:peptide/nickel transport system substrate-binding protein